MDRNGQFSLVQNGEIALSSIKRGIHKPQFKLFGLISNRHNRVLNQFLHPPDFDEGCHASVLVIVGLVKNKTILFCTQGRNMLEACINFLLLIWWWPYKGNHIHMGTHCAPRESLQCAPSTQKMLTAIIAQQVTPFTL